MSITIRVHEGDPCKWCGAVKPGSEITCVTRAAPPTLRPEPARREPACEDAAAITARMTELRIEREAAWNTSDETAALDPNDCCF